VSRFWARFSLSTDPLTVSVVFSPISPAPAFDLPDLATLGIPNTAGSCVPMEKQGVPCPLEAPKAPSADSTARHMGNTRKSSQTIGCETGRGESVEQVLLRLDLAALRSRYTRQAEPSHVSVRRLFWRSVSAILRILTAPLPVLFRRRPRDLDALATSEGGEGTCQRLVTVKEVLQKIRSGQKVWSTHQPSILPHEPYHSSPAVCPPNPEALLIARLDPMSGNASLPGLLSSLFMRPRWFRVACRVRGNQQGSGARLPRHLEWVVVGVLSGLVLLAPATVNAFRPAGPVLNSGQNEAVGAPSESDFSELSRWIDQKAMNWSREISEAEELSSTLGIEPARMMFRADDLFAGSFARPSLKLEGRLRTTAGPVSVKRPDSTRYTIRRFYDGWSDASRGPEARRTVEATW